MSQDFSLCNERRVTCLRPSAKLWSYKAGADGTVWLSFQINEVQGDLACYTIKTDDIKDGIAKATELAQQFADIQFYNDNANFHPEPVESEQDMIDLLTAEFYSNLGTWPIDQEEYQHAVYP